MTIALQKPPVFGTAAEIELATFYVADLLLGIPIHKVEEISRYSSVTPVPGAPQSVCGVMSLRGEVVTVLDLRAVLVIMTGMGNDGSLGCRRPKHCGARIIAQDAATCVVFGMPREPIETGVADIVAPLGRIAAEIARLAGQGAVLCK
jgi:chemotaxis response regulator CheB